MTRANRAEFASAADRASAAPSAYVAARSMRRPHASRGPLPIDSEADVATFMANVDRRLQPYFRRATRRVDFVEPLGSAVAAQLEQGGKRVRAALCVASCELFGTSFAASLDFAAAIEFIHNLTLVHDDIADGDALRRSQPSVWRRHGVPHAINIGDVFVPLAADAILAAGYSDALKVRLLGLVTEQSLEMAAGQALDLNLVRSAVSYDQYYQCTARKTGAFLGMATVGGGMIGGAGKRDLERLRAFAELGGVSFQIRDDLLDMASDKGRPPGSDVLEGKRTLLVVYAAERASVLDRKRLYRILVKPRGSTTSAEVRWVLELFRRTGAVEYATGVATRLAEQACQQLIALPDVPAKYRLLRLARYFGARRN